MKKIIAPVDFSDTSLNALSFAAELARRTSTHLVVLNILQEGEEEEDAKNKLESLASGLNQSFGEGFTCEPLLAYGDLVSTMKKIIAEQRPDLIVMGTKGASGLKRILIGSNTVKLIASTTMPVLVIPEVARFENFLLKGKNRIVLATDLDLLEHERRLDILKEIAKVIVEPKLRVVSVRPENTTLPHEKKMERDFLLSFFRPEIAAERMTVFSSNVIRGINFYLEEHEDSGLLAMIARDTGYLIQKHYTREMASQTQLPLLILHDAET